MKLHEARAAALGKVRFHFKNQVLENNEFKMVNLKKAAYNAMESRF